METLSNVFFESTNGAFGFDCYESDFYMQAVDSSNPGDEDEKVDDEEEEGNDSDGGDPPLEEGVVHSPVPPQTGGKPR